VRGYERSPQTDREVETATEAAIRSIHERDFDAPRDLVFRAYTEPDLIKQWLGPRRFTMEIDRYDIADGGWWRYVQRDEQGNEHGFHGVFHGDPTPDAMVQTFEWEGLPGHVSLDTATLEEIEGGRTVVRTVSVYQSEQDRDGMYESGMAEGMSDGYDRLEELLTTLKTRH
jgi:uncharacterized protein YndB with AHSA1/START domain